MAANAFAVYPSSVAPTSLSFAFDFTAALWTRVRVNFWAGTHGQIQLGHFRVENIQVQGSCNCALAYANILAPFGQGESPVIRVFINGFDVASDTLQISVSPTNLQGSRLTIRITTGGATVLRGIWLSWLAFSPSTASFGSYGGQVSQSKYSGSVSSDITNSLYQTPYLLFGLNLLSLAASRALSFASSIDRDFVLTISASSVVEEFSLVYVAVGVLPGRVCAACGSRQVANGGSCVASCDAATFAFTFRDGGVACRTCSSKLGLILSNGRCVQGSVTTSTITTVISPAGTSSSSHAATANTAPSSNNPIRTATTSSNSSIRTVTNSSDTPTPMPTIIEQNLSIISSPANTPVSVPVSCAVNAFFNGNECVCDVGFVFVNNRCQAPNLPVTVPIIIAYPDQRVCNNTNTIPAANTPNNQPPNTPASGTNRTNNNSSTTTTNTTTNSSSRPPSSNSSINCGPNSFNNGLGVCVCNAGFFFENNSCVAGIQCGANSRAVNGSCVCDSGFSLVGGVCSRCPQGALWSSSANQCIFVCGQNSAYSASERACVCNPGFGLHGGSCQVCPQGYFISDGYCVTCPINSAYSSASRSCECLSGFFTNQWGICARRCLTNEVYNTTTQTCVCLQGLGRVNGACQICPAGSTPTPDGSACSACRAN